MREKAYILTASKQGAKENIQTYRTWSLVIILYGSQINHVGYNKLDTTFKLRTRSANTMFIGKPLGRAQKG
jgi:hypothetical protein